MKELINAFNALSKEEKIQFINEITPDVCLLFGENPQKMMQSMMPMCKGMMKDCNMDMSQTMSMMREK